MLYVAVAIGAVGVFRALRIYSPARSEFQRYKRGQASWLTYTFLLVGFAVLFVLSFPTQVNVPLSH